MVATLLKYEYLRTRSMMGVILGLAFGLVLIGSVAAWLDIILISELGMFLAGLAVFGLPLVVGFAIAFDYWNSSYRRTGYFTHTLPISSGTIYWAKLMWATLMNVLSWLVALVLGFSFSRIAFADQWPGLGVIWEKLVTNNPGWLWPAIVGAILFMILTNVTVYFYAVSKGSEESFNRMGVGGPIVVGIVVYVVMQVVMMLAIFAIPLALNISESGEMGIEVFSFLPAMLTQDSPEMIPIGFITPMIATPFIMITLTLRSWKKKTALV